MKIKITTDHAASSYGQPVILIDNELQDYAPGLQKCRQALGLNCEELGEKLGVSGRTIENWEQGRRMISTPALKLLAALFEK